MLFAVGAVVGKEEDPSVSGLAECSRWDIDVEEIREIGRSVTSENLKTETATFVYDSFFNGKPV